MMSLSEDSWPDVSEVTLESDGVYDFLWVSYGSTLCRSSASDKSFSGM